MIQKEAAFDCTLLLLVYTSEHAYRNLGERKRLVSVLLLKMARSYVPKFGANASQP